ncbi:hypothetical protein ACFX11_039911 [Malus domestica]
MFRFDPNVRTGCMLDKRSMLELLDSGTNTNSTFDTSSNIDRNHGPGSVHEADWSTPNGNKNNAAASGDHINKGNTFSSPRRGVTYKEVLLQKGTNKGGIGKKEENKVNNKEEVESSVADDDSETNSKDDLLELFESAWLMTSPRKNKGKYAPRSVSFIF